MWKAIGLCLLCAQAHALPITIEPDNYRIGSSLPNDQGATFRFVTHKAHSSEFTYADPIVGVQLPAPTGSRVLTQKTYDLNIDKFDYLPTNPYEISTLDDFSALRIDFENPTDFVSVNLFSKAGDTAKMYAYSADGSLIGSLAQTPTYKTKEDPSCAGVGCYTWMYTLAMQDFSADISFILVGSESASAGVDSITYDVPEPSTLAMFGIGLIGLLRRRRS